MEDQLAIAAATAAAREREYCAAEIAAQTARDTADAALESLREENNKLTQ